MTVALARPEATLEFPLYRVRRLGLHDRHASAGAPADPAAPARRGGGPQHRRLYFRLSRLADRPLRHRALARIGRAQAAQHRLPPRPQRGPRRDRDLGRAISQQLSRRHGRWRVRHLVRQGPRRRSLGRRAPPRQFHRRFAQGRRDRARRRRPRREILDRRQFLRHVVHRRRHAGDLSVQHPGAARFRPARHRHVALFRLLGRHEGRDRRRRGRRHRLCRARSASDRHSRTAEPSARRRMGAGDRRAGRAGGAALQSQAAGRARLRARQRPQPHRRRRRGRRKSASSRPARPGRISCRRSAISALPTTAPRLACACSKSAWSGRSIL